MKRFSTAMTRFALLLFIPLSLLLRYGLHVGPVWVFLTGAVAVAVLADWVRRATEQLAERAGSAIGGLLNVSFGSIAELVLSLFVVSISLRTGRTTMLPGVVHLVMFAAYLFLSFVP